MLNLYHLLVLNIRLGEVDIRPIYPLVQCEPLWDQLVEICAIPW